MKNLNLFGQSDIAVMIRKYTGMNIYTRIGV